MENLATTGKTTTTTKGGENSMFLRYLIIQRNPPLVGWYVLFFFISYVHIYKIVSHQTSLKPALCRVHLSMPLRVLLLYHSSCPFHIPLNKCARVYLINPLYACKLFPDFYSCKNAVTINFGAKFHKIFIFISLGEWA